MLQLAKVFHFEMAHAIHGYEGPCKNIHGHSYELQVTVSSVHRHSDFIPAPGFIVDFKELKQLVTASIIKRLDHKLVLSATYIREHPSVALMENLITWQVEPTAENLLLYIQKTLAANMPDTVRLSELKLYETKDSFAKWVDR